MSYCSPSPISSGINHLNNPCTPSPLPSYYKPLEAVCCVAMALFGVTLAPKLFVTGLVVGALYQFTLKIFSVESEIARKSRPGCGEGNGELYMGRGLFPYEIIAITAFLFFEHMKHHPQFFVPLLGGFLGIRAFLLIDKYCYLRL